MTTATIIAAWVGAVTGVASLAWRIYLELSFRRQIKIQKQAARELAQDFEVFFRDIRNVNHATVGPLRMTREEAQKGGFDA